MRAESSKHFQFGFVLNESDLRRLIGTAEEQFKKLPDSSPIVYAFEVKFRNGAVATTSSLDEVVSQENLGSAQITSLRITMNVGLEDSQRRNSVFISFINLELADVPDNQAISFRVAGESRDWVFITSSLLEERIVKSKRYPLKRYMGLSGGSFLSPYFALSLAGLMIGLIWFAVRPAPWESWEYRSLRSNTNEQKSKPLSEKLADEIKAKGIKDPVEAIVERERLVEKRLDEAEAREAEESKRIQQELSQRPRPRGMSLSVFFAIAGLAPPVALGILSAFLGAFYPPYNFCWGDYTEVFRRKEAVRRFVLVVILAGVVVSFIGGILANFTRVGR